MRFSDSLVCVVGFGTDLEVVLVPQSSANAQPDQRVVGDQHPGHWLSGVETNHVVFTPGS
jgi:hypothetical protein